MNEGVHHGRSDNDRISSLVYLLRPFLPHFTYHTPMPRKTPSPPITPTKLNGGDKGISAPQKVIHEMHVDTEFNWTGKQINDPSNVFEILQELGRGTFGIVYKARVCTYHLCLCIIAYSRVIKFKDAHNRVFAIKTIRGDWENIDKEIRVLQQVRGDNIVHYYGCVSTIYYYFILLIIYV